MTYTTRSKYTLVGTLLLVLLITGCKSEKIHEAKGPETPAIQVQTAKVIEQTPQLQIEIMGTVQAVHSATIATKVSGNITQLPVRLGSKVTEGDLLLQLDAGEITARLQQTKAQLSQAKRNLMRDQVLLEKNAATPEAVKAGIDTVRIAEAAYQEASTMMKYTRVEAPFSGLITNKLVNVGDLVTPGLPLLQLDNNQMFQVIASIPEKLILNISVGDTFNINIEVANAEVIGTVSEIAPNADPISRTTPIKLSLPTSSYIRPGQFARLYVNFSQEKTTTVPKTAIDKLGQLERVFTISDGRAKLRLVRTGAQYGDVIEILSGLEPDETVVIQSTGLLIDNQRVNQ